MKKSFVFCIVIFFIGISYLSAQDSLSNGKALNFPFKKYGISIGNSYEFTGIRINFADKNVKKINGLNVTFWAKGKKRGEKDPNTAVVNGISLGIIPVVKSTQFINLGLLGIGARYNLNGVSIGGLFLGSGGNINGLSISSLLTMADGDNSAISGIAFSGIGLFAGKAINGLAIGGLGVGSNGDIIGLGIGGLAVGTDGNITGVVSSLACIFCKKNFEGIAVTGGYLKSEMFKGVAIAGYAKTNQMYGLSIALYNRTKELHGVQLGLINYAENNPKGLRRLPFLNLHF